MTIDTHHHFWNPSLRTYYWMQGDELAPIRKPFGPDDLRPLLKEAQISGTVLVQTLPDPGETDEFLELAEKTDFIRGVVGWIDLENGQITAELEGLLSRHNGNYLVGIRHQAHDEEDKDWLMRSDVLGAIGSLGRFGLAYDLLVRERELPAAIGCVDRAPDMTFVLDHIAKPRIAERKMQPWRGLITEIARRPNVFCKLSGMITEARWRRWEAADLRPYVDHVLETFGPSRIMFGSDWPVCLLAGEYQEVYDAAQNLVCGLSRDEQNAIMETNAGKAYRLV